VFFHISLIRSVFIAFFQRFSELEKKSAVPLGQLFPTAGPKALRLLEKLLTFDPRQRMTVDDALKDLYLNKYHDPDDEPICQPTFGFEFEKQVSHLPCLAMSKRLRSTHYLCQYL